MAATNRFVLIAHGDTDRVRLAVIACEGVFDIDTVFAGIIVLTIFALI